MRKGTWAVIALALVVVLGVLVAACGGEEATTTSVSPTTASTTATTQVSETTASTEAATSTTVNTTPVKIGLAISLTGNGAAPAEQIKQGFETEVEYINSNGGINGRMIELTVVDDQSMMDTSMAAISSLIDKKVDVVVGPFPQWTTTGARELTEEAGVFHIAFGPPTLAEQSEDQSKYKYSFIDITGPDVTADAWTKAMIAQGHKNVVAIADQITIHQEALTLLTESFKQNNIAYTKMDDSWGLDETDVTAIANKVAAKVKEVKADALILASNPIHVNTLIKTLKSLGVTVPIYGSAAGSHPLVIFAAAGNDPANVAGQYAVGPAIVDPTKIPDDYPGKADLVAFIGRWQKKFPEQPFASLYLGFGYDTVHLIEQAVANAETPDAAGYAAAMERIDWWGSQTHLVYSATDHLGAHGGMFLWQYAEGGGWNLVMDLNAMKSE